MVHRREARGAQPRNDVIVIGLIVAAGIPHTRKSHKWPSGSGRRCRGDRGAVPACRQGSARLPTGLRLNLSANLCQDVLYLARLVVWLANLGPSFDFPPCVFPLPGYPNPDGNKEDQATHTDGGGRLQDFWHSHKASQKQDEERSKADLSSDPTSLRLAFKLVTDLFQSRKHIVFVRHTPNPLTTTNLRALVAANTKPKPGEINGQNRGHERRMHSIDH